MPSPSLTELYAFILHAKASCYVGGGVNSPSCRPNSHDLQFTDGDWTYMTVISAARISSAGRSSGTRAPRAGR